MAPDTDSNSNAATPKPTNSDALDVPLAFPEIVAFYQKSVELAAIRENLKLTPTQQLAKLQARMDSLPGAERGNAE